MIRDNLDYIHSHPEIYFTQEARKGGYICPVCGNGSGEDGTGVKLIKGQSFRYKCFKCDTSGDVINFYSAEHHISNSEAIAQISALYGLEVPKKKIKRITHTHRNATLNEKPSANQIGIEIIANDIILATGHLHETDYFFNAEFLTRLLKNTIAVTWKNGFTRQSAEKRRFILRLASSFRQVLNLTLLAPPTTIKFPK